jgi:hypothetical protein
MSSPPRESDGTDAPDEKALCEKALAERLPGDAAQGSMTPTA